MPDTATVDEAIMMRICRINLNSLFLLFYLHVVGAQDISSSKLRKRSKWGLFPLCEANLKLHTLAHQAVSWCNPTHVPPPLRAPKKLQGLYWLQDQSLSHVAACFSRGLWDNATLTLEISLWSDLVFRDGLVSRAIVSGMYHSDQHYMIRFNDSSLSFATIAPKVSGFFAISNQIFNVETPFQEEPGNDPGETWTGTTNYGLGSHKWFANKYFGRRILDGNTKVVHKNVDAMIHALDPADKNLNLLCYSQDCTIATPGQASEHEHTPFSNSNAPFSTSNIPLLILLIAGSFSAFAARSVVLHRHQLGIVEPLLFQES